MWRSSRGKSVFVLLMVLHHCTTDAQSDACSLVKFEDHYSVSENDPPSTVVLTIMAPPPGVHWSMAVNYDEFPNVRNKLDAYLILQQQSGGDYLLTVNRQLDIEDIYDKLGIKVNTLSLRMTCKQDGHQDQSQDVFVQVNPVNEFSPEFLDSPYFLQFHEREAVGFLLISLDTKARDKDIRPATGEIYAYTILPYDNPQVDGREYFTMSDYQSGRIELAKRLNYEELESQNRTTLYLNVSVMDHSGNSSRTTVEIKVVDDDDLSPEFYVSSICAPRPLKTPQCYVTYKARVLANTTGILSQIQPAKIFAHDRDTIGNPVEYSLKDSVDTPGLTYHFKINKTNGILTIVKPFLDPDIYSFVVVAEEKSYNKFTAQTTLQLTVYTPDFDPGATTTLGPGGQAGGHAPSAGGSGTGTGSTGNGSGHGPSVGASRNADDCTSQQVAIIGMAILGVIVLALVVALFLTCLRLRKQRLARVGSVTASTVSSTKSFIHDEHMSSTSGHQTYSDKQKAQVDVLQNLPESGKKAPGQLPPLQLPSSSSGTGPNPGLLDGSQPLPSGGNTDFYTARGKVKVPLLLTGDNEKALKEPIYIDDGIASS